MQRPVWITGAGGLIGSWLARLATDSGIPCPLVALTRQQLDLTDFRRLRREFKAQNPQAVLHCAALSRSPACQAEPLLARKINVELTALLAELARDAGFVFFSSDLVFDGRAGNYAETDLVNPLSIYAETKVAAERIVLANPNHLVVRTSLNSGPSLTGDRAFDEEIRRAWQRGESSRLFTDEFRSPIAAEVTARAVWELFVGGARGLYHVAGSERLSRWQIGQLLAERWPDLNPKLIAASLRDYEGAPRPPDTSLNCFKAQQRLSFALPRWSEWIRSAGAPEFSRQKRIEGAL